MFLEISQNPRQKTCARVCFLIKLQAWEVCNFIKKETVENSETSEISEILFQEFQIRVKLENKKTRNSFS